MRFWRGCHRSNSKAQLIMTSEPDLLTTQQKELERWVKNFLADSLRVRVDLTQLNNNGSQQLNSSWKHLVSVATAAQGFVEQQQQLSKPSATAERGGGAELLNPRLQQNVVGRELVNNNNNRWKKERRRGWTLNWRRGGIRKGMETHVI